MKIRSADPFRDVVEKASTRRDELLACLDRGELSYGDPSWGEIVGYGNVLRWAFEAAGMWERNELPIPPGQIGVVAKDEASLELRRLADELEGMAEIRQFPAWQFWRHRS